jgi:hypothetical protein
MNTDRWAERIAGALFLIALVTSILGGALIDGGMGDPAGAAANRNPIVAGVLLELVNAVAVVGIASMLWPSLSRQSAALAMAYVGIRIVEAFVQVAASTVPLAILAWGGVPAAGGEAAGALMLALRTHLVGTMLAILFGVGALILYAIVYRFRLLPRFIPIWGFVGAAGILAWNVLALFEIQTGMYMALPIITNELFLGIWLIVKGFKAGGD